MADEFDNTNVMAVESFTRNSGYVLEEYLPELQGEQWKYVVRTMIEDSTYGAIMFIIRSIFRSRAAMIRMPEGTDGDPELEMQRDYLETALFHAIGDDVDTDSQMSFDDLISMVIDDLLPWGFATIHPKFERRDDGLAYIKRLIQISPDTVERWDIEEPIGIIRGLYQRSHYDWQLRLVPRDQFIHFRTEMSKGNPQGRSIFRSSYKSFQRREKLQTTEAILAERGTGFPLVTCDADFLRKANGPNATAADKKIIAQIQDIPKNVRMNSQSGAVIYTDYFRDVAGNPTSIPKIKFEFSPVGATNKVDYREAIRDYDLNILRSCMAQFAANGTLRGGSRAMDESQTDTFMKAVNGFSELMCSVINRQLVSRMWELNGWDTKVERPYVMMDAIEVKDLTKIGSLLSSMAGAGAQLFPNEDLTNELLDMMGLPPIAEAEL